MRSKYFYLLTLIIAFFLFSFEARSSHIAGGELTYQHIGGDTFEFTLKISFFCSGTAGNPTAVDLNKNSFPAGLGQTYLSSSCTTATWNPGGWVATDTVLVTPVCPNTLTSCNGGSVKGIEQYTFKQKVVLSPKCDAWKMGVRYNARNTSSNLATGGRLYVETSLNSSTDSTDSSPIFTSLPSPALCANQSVSYSYGAIDPDGDSLVFALENARSNVSSLIQYNTGTKIPFSGVTINSNNGDLSFIAPATTGEYTVVVFCASYDKTTKKLLGTVMRDIQFAVTNLGCAGNAKPVVVAGGITNMVKAAKIDSVTIKTKAGANLVYEMPFSDADATDTLTATSNALTSLPGTKSSVQVGVNPANVKVSWTVPTTASGSYLVSFDVKDNNCPLNAGASVTTTIQIVGDLTSASITGIKETCYKTGDGILTVNHTGGIGPFNYKWDSAGVRISQNTKTLTNVPANISYTVWVVDSFDFDSIKTTGFNLAQTLPVAIGTNGSTVTNIGCNGGCTGEIKLTNVINGNNSVPGLEGYEYKWSGTTDTTSNPKNLCAGTHLVTIGDDRNCDTVYSFFISQPPVVEVNMTDSVMVSCKGGSDGSAKSSAKIIECGVYSSTSSKCTSTTAAAIGAGTSGTPTNGFPTPYGSAKSGRQQYLYLASELSAAGFTKGRISSITFPYRFGFNINYKDILFSIGCTDSSNLDSGFVNGGFQVFSAANLTLNTTDLGSGFSRVTFAQEFEWDGNSNVVITICNGKTTGGNLSFNYTATSFNSVAYVTSDTSNACVIDSANTLSKNRPNVTFEYCDPAITYSWNTTPVQTTDSAKTLSAGTYSVVASNLAGCKDTATVTITEPLLGLVLATTTIKTLDCNADTNGSVSVEVTGGTPGFRFEWPTGVLTSSDSIATNLKGGIKYVITVTDSKGCFDTISVQLAEPSGMTFGSSTVKDVDCKGGNDGEITVVAAGGSGVYNSYVWTPASAGTGAVVNNLKAGNYTVRVTDSKLCFKGRLVKQNDTI